MGQLGIDRALLLTGRTDEEIETPEGKIVVKPSPEYPEACCRELCFFLDIIKNMIIIKLFLILLRS